jgi:hypothetical protein
MGEESSTITFESLYDMVRKEKTNDEIQVLNAHVFSQIINYLKNKAETYKRSKEDPNFNPNELEKIKTQIINARKLVKELYERRERKILQLAINKSRVKTVDDSSLLEAEMPFLNEITKILDHYREDILLNLINTRLPSGEKPFEEKKQEEEKEPVEEKEETKEEANDEIRDLPGENKQEKKEELKKIKKETVLEEEKIKIRFLGNVPRFLGKNLEIYGPFEQGDIAELPKDFAKIIIERKMAEVFIKM